ncbi:hypothetical protein O181_002065 [Austropuccinia psidii MF-1]|uniref:Piwi domain-containing protein n=1 Tax=Austropuccinia psidii MF-1 TaxID=1389203 RepID=A0A9Q3BBQ9_9BASI|nr:hypothetical protein [Austropuccinia psidii MF-1]
MGNSVGSPISISLNLFKLDLKRTGEFFHYNIEMSSSTGASTPIALKKRIFLSIREEYKQSNGIGPVFDGDKIVYSHKKLTPLEGEVTVPSFKNPGEFEKFKYIWRLADVFDLLFGPNGPTLKNKTEEEQNALFSKARRALQALNVVIRFLLAAECPSTVRAFFPDGPREMELNGGVTLKRGFITHLRTGTTKKNMPPPDNLFLAMDITCATFLGGRPRDNPMNTLADLCCRVLNVEPQRLRQLDDNQYKELHRILRRFKINIKRGQSDKGISKSIDHFTLTNSSNEIFEMDDRKISVEDFFLEVWGTKLRYPYLPNVVTMGKGKKTVYPMELCSIRPGQRYLMKLNGEQQAQALKFQTLKPDDRFREIMNARQNTMTREHEELLSEYGLKISREFVQAEARVLPPPTIEYGHQFQMQVQSGQWNISKPNLEILTPKALTSWAVIVCTRAHAPPQAIMNFLSALKNVLNRLVADEPPPIVHLEGNSPTHIKNAIENAGRAAFRTFPRIPPQLFLCITDEKSSLYSGIKLEGDLFSNRKVTTQCMVLKHIKMAKDQYLTNLALKINLKLGGLNHRLPHLLDKCGREPTMVVGVDLTHNNVSFKMKPSIVGMVGSLDHTLLRYTAAAGVQPLLEPSEPEGRPRCQEPIQDFRTLLLQLLGKWAKANTGPKYPRRLLIFRDGVSDGEFSQVLETEFKAAKSAVEKIAGGENDCKITFIVCVKNHRLRFAPDGRDRDRSGNAPAGTVLDSRIGDPFYFDFFAQTQGGIQGTSRPTRYVVLQDECRFSADDLQAIINMICSGFQRATRSVSIATPAYYADIVATRVKIWLNIDDDASTIASGGSKTQTSEDRANDVELYQARIQEMMAKLDSIDQQMWWS